MAVHTASRELYSRLTNVWRIFSQSLSLNVRSTKVESTIDQASATTRCSFDKTAEELSGHEKAAVIAIARIGKFHKALFIVSRSDNHPHGYKTKGFVFNLSTPKLATGRELAASMRTFTDFEFLSSLRPLEKIGLHNRESSREGTRNALANSGKSTTCKQRCILFLPI
jgi:hypothetical protein